MQQEIRMLNVISGILLRLVALALLASGLCLLEQQPIFTLKKIQINAYKVNGLRHLNPSTIHTVIIPHLKGNFFTINLDIVRKAFESMPWVRKAIVHRQWPNVLTVTIEEHLPLAIWDGSGYLLSKYGDLFAVTLDEIEKYGKPLRVFSGPDGSEKEVLSHLIKFQEWFAPLGLSLDEINLSSSYIWSIKLSNNITVKLGREKNKRIFKDRVTRLVKVYPRLLSLLQNNIESIDTRYPNGIALKMSHFPKKLESNRK